MPVPIYGCMAHGAYILSLDDETVLADAGTEYSAYLLSNTFESAGGEYSKFRRTVQAVHVNGSAEVALTPYRDGLETGQTIERTVDTGDNPSVDAPFNSLGSTHQLHIEVSDFDAPVELGKCRNWLIPRRSAR